MHVCVFEAEETTPLSKINIHPNVDLLSVALIIQLALIES